MTTSNTIAARATENTGAIIGGTVAVMLILAVVAVIIAVLAVSKMTR